jgi:hypothetical protein
MADNDSRTEGDRFSPAVPPYAEPYLLKGCHDPVAMIRAVSAVVHESVKPPAAYEQYSSVTDGHDRLEDKEDKR